MVTMLRFGRYIISTKVLVNFISTSVGLWVVQTPFLD